MKTIKNLVIISLVFLVLANVSLALKKETPPWSGIKDEVAYKDACEEATIFINQQVKKLIKEHKLKVSDNKPLPGRTNWVLENEGLTLFVQVREGKQKIQELFILFRPEKEPILFIDFNVLKLMTEQELLEKEVDEETLVKLFDKATGKYYCAI